jgi:hypothetical protein
MRHERELTLTESMRMLKLGGHIGDADIRKVIGVVLCFGR